MTDPRQPLDDCARCHSYITMAMTRTPSRRPRRLNQGSIICPESCPQLAAAPDASDRSKCPQLPPPNNPSPSFPDKIGKKARSGVRKGSTAAPSTFHYYPADSIMQSSAKQRTALKACPRQPSQDQEHVDEQASKITGSRDESGEVCMRRSSPRRRCGVANGLIFLGGMTAN